MELISSRAASIICIIVLSCFAQNDKPVNTATEQSKRTNLTCCSERGSIAWKHQQLNNAGVPEQICLDKICNRPGHSVDNSIPGCYHLIIDSTAIDAAGLYQCNEAETSSVRGAYLVVYDFSCGVDFGNSDDLVEGDIVKFHCSVSWWGKWPFEIRLLKEDGKGIKQKVVINDVNPYYNSSFDVNVSKPNFPSYTIQFAFLNNEITDPNVDRSCPTVNWTSPAKKVKYGPSIIKLSCPTEKCERPIDDTINCSADGNPIPELHWLDWDDKKITSGSVLELKSLGTHEYKCVATNIIRGESYKKNKNIKVNVKPKPDVDGSRCAEAIICKDGIIALVVIVSVSIIAGAIVFFLKHKKRKLCVKKRTLSTGTCIQGHIELHISEEMEIPPQKKAPLPTKEESPEDDKHLSQHGEQKDPSLHVQSHKEYNNGLSSAKSLVELGPHITYRPTEVYHPADSETSGDEGSSVHPARRHAHPEAEGASLLSGTDVETEDEYTLQYGS